MAYFTKTEAKLAAQEKTRKSSRSSWMILESLGLESFVAGAQTFDIFLSHSINDAELVLGMKELMTAMDLSVYVDWDVDADLNRAKVTKDSADLLRRRMRASRSLIYMVTEQSSSSRWMPWELGYFDGYNSDKVAVLPLLDTRNGIFPEQEYVSLYPQVKRNDLDHSIYVEKENEWTTLKDFLGEGKLWKPIS